MMLLLPQLAWMIMVGAPRQNPKIVNPAPLQTVAECAKGSDAPCTK